MTRQQALDRINQKLAFAYQTLQKNSENLPFMPKFTFSQSPADVIKTRGATASPNATLKIGTDIVPMWATFPESSMTPNYPDISFIMKSGGKLVKRKKR